MDAALAVNNALHFPDRGRADPPRRKVPDFWAEGRIAFKVVSLFERNLSGETKIIVALKGESSRMKALGFRFHNIPTDKSPKIFEARARIRDAFAG